MRGLSIVLSSSMRPTGMGWAYLGGRLSEGSQFKDLRCSLLVATF